MSKKGVMIECFSLVRVLCCDGCYGKAGSLFTPAGLPADIESHDGTLVESGFLYSVVCLDETPMNVSTRASSNIHRQS